MNPSSPTRRIRVFVQPIVLLNYRGNDDDDKDEQENGDRQRSIPLACPDALSSMMSISVPPTAQSFRPSEVISPLSCTSTSTFMNSEEHAAQHSSSPSSQFKASVDSDQKQRKWMQRYKELLVFYQQYNHFVVPRHRRKTQGLALWLRSQQQQYEKFKMGKPSRLSQERVSLLNEIGFPWEGYGTCWKANFAALVNFYDEHQHCDVPSSYHDKQLVMWVKAQRQSYKLYFEGRISQITSKKIVQLEKVGFVWASK